MMHSVKWNILAENPDVFDNNPNNLPPLAAKLLSIRGITGDKIKPFLNPTLGELPPPDTLCGIKDAVDILVKGLENDVPVIIYGDYDADGITGTALLSIFLKKTGFQCATYIPDRLTEGYSLHNKALKKLKNQEILSENDEMILLTVDCGISSHQEVQEARAMGYSVIITDHHTPSETIPDANAIINPHLPDCEFPFKDLAGVGVAFYLIAALRAKLTEIGYWQSDEPPNLKEYLDLVALGTVADMVSLTGANRILVKAGLEIISKSPRPGVKALLKKANTSAGSVSAESISFQLAPRLNAAGRTGNPSIALDMLIAENSTRAEEKASLLEEANILRRDIAENMFAEACILADKQLITGKKGIVLAKPGWHKGMLGLVASRIASKYNHPTIIFTIEEDGTATGSGRSVNDLDIHAVLDDISDMLIRFGGHKAALGLAIQTDRIDDFRDKFVDAIGRVLSREKLEPVLDIDLKASFDQVFDQDFLETYTRMEPFGFNNPQPVFYVAIQSDEISDLKRIGNNSIRFKLSNENMRIDCVGFDKGDFFDHFNGDQEIKLAYKITLNEFRGMSKWEARVEDVKLERPTN